MLIGLFDTLFLYLYNMGNNLLERTVTMKKITAIILSAILSLNLFASAATSTDKFSLEESMASDLKELNLFKGVSETDFDLDRAPTRIEALVMLIRVLGQENVALSGTWSHPFTDVPAWADKYVGYAYSNGLTKGVSSNKFGSGNASSAMYFTFVLRALGYSDTNGEDFTWDNPFDFANGAGLDIVNVDIDNFMRSDVVTVSYAALSATLKDSSTTLASKLINAGVFSSDKFYSVYDALKCTSPRANYALNDHLRDFIVANGQTETISGFGFVAQTYKITFYNEEQTYCYDLKYTPLTGILFAEERYIGGGDPNFFSTTLYFAGNGTSYTDAKVIVDVSDNGTFIVAAGHVNTSSYTTETPLTFYLWAPTQITSDYYTQETCEAIAGAMITDIINTTEVIFTEEKLGMSLSDFGYKRFFK